MKWLYCIISFFLPIAVYGQNEAAIWYFSRNVGLDFRSGAPKELNDGALNTLEGCATISSKEGGLLFYTDGISVWDRRHIKMPNGIGLKGHWSSTQAAIIIPKPGDENIYYIFTTDENSGEDPPYEGVHYSTVNMCLNNGFGDVVFSSKNIFLSKPSTERLAATYHSNGRNIWVMTHEASSNRYIAFLVTDQGVHSLPVISSVGIVHTLEKYSLGEMKFSPNGKTIAVAIQDKNNVEVSDFDASTGKVSNPYLLVSDDPLDEIHSAYGVSFSPNSTLLYVTASIVGEVNQFNLKAGSLEAIRNSRYKMNCLADAYGLQLGPDGKLYVLRYADVIGYIGVINEPNKIGFASNFDINGIKLSRQVGYPGLCFPNFISSYFDSTPYISYNRSCQSEVITFQLQKATLVRWDFGDPPSGASNVSTQAISMHQFSKAGEYVVKATYVADDGSEKSITKHITIQPGFSLGRDTLLCAGSSLTLDASYLENLYSWQDGSSTPTFTINKKGTYWIDICIDGCMRRDSINVDFYKPLNLNLGRDTVICSSQAFTLSTFVKGGTYLWQNGSTKESILVKESGTYSVQLTHPCGRISDTITILFEQPPLIELGENITACVGDTIWLDVFSSLAQQYFWYKEGQQEAVSRGASLPVTEAGIYRVELRSEHCLAKDAIEVVFSECEDKLFIPNVITPNGDGKNDHFEIKGILSGKWQLEIYNRYGKNVYRTASYQNDWNGLDQAGNIFYYYFFNPKSHRKYKGWIQVLR